MAVKKLASGRWQADCELSRGKRVRRSFDRKAEAVKFEASVRSKSAAVSDRLSADADKRRLSVLFQLWFDLHGHTLRDGARRFSALQRFALRVGDPVGSRFTAAMYAHDRRVRSEQGLSDKTLNNELTYIRACFNELHSLGEISYQNPLERVRAVRIQERELTWLSAGQVSELVDVIRSRRDTANPHLELIVLVCLATGARWSEAERLVPSSLSNGSLVFSNTKSAKVRAVPIADALAVRLVEHWRLVGKFTSSIGAFRRALGRTSIQLPAGQASHVLRHTFASHFIMNGGNILTLQRILGHSSVQVTMRYAHLAPDHLQDAVRLSPLAGDALVTRGQKSEGWK